MRIRMRNWRLLLVLAGMVSACTCNDNTNNGKETKKETNAGTAAQEVKYFGKVKTPKGNVLRVSVGPALEHLDPGQVSAAYEAPYAEALIEGLVNRDLDDINKAVPGLAETWESTPDGMTWTFHLRKGMRWSGFKGTVEVDPETDKVTVTDEPGIVDLGEVTTSDVRYSFERCLDPDVACEYRVMFTDIFFAGMPEYNAAEQAYTAEKNPVKKKVLKAAWVAQLEKMKKTSIETPDPYTFVLHLDRASNLMPKIMSFPVFRPVRKDTAVKFGDAWTRPENGAWSGPYVLAQSTEAQMILVRNPNSWWWKDHEGFDAIIGSTPKACDAYQNDYEAGNVDVMMVNCRAEGKMLDEYRGKVADLVLFPESRLTYITVNEHDPTLQDVRVRQAIGFAINRNRMNHEVFKEIEVPTGTLVPTGFAGHTPGDDYGYTYDPEKAKRLLKEAGFAPGTGPKIVMKHRPPTRNKGIAEAVQRDLQAVGFTVELFPNDAKVHAPALRKGEYQIAEAGWGADYEDPKTYLILAVSNSAYNFAKWKDPEYDRLVEEAFRATEPVERVRLNRMAEKRLIDSGTLVPLATSLASMLVKPYVEGIVGNILDDHQLRYVHFRRSR